MPGPARLLRRTHRWLSRRGIDAPAAFQCFLFGGIASLCCLLSLYFLATGPSFDWRQEALALIIGLTLVTGLMLMAAGYLTILVLRLSRFLDTDDDRAVGTNRDVDPRDIDPRDIDPRDVDPRDIDPRKKDPARHPDRHQVSE